MPGEGTVVKSKKRKGNSGNYIRMEEDSSIPPVLGPFEPLASESKIMKDIVTKLPQRLDQRNRKAQLANLEKAYVGLEKSHGKLSISHRKIKKREKSRDKFFTQIWKEVKGLWKVLNENDPLTTLRTNEDGYEPFTWNDDGRGEDSGSTDTNGDD
ncbi:hypothetical protein KY290_033705 [Solanum tuberosum]|uniref:Uncharacterized protein n=1 Tax=Solanum tuberosum TaxID=4113 RepID=A0ABQ7U139_SOLTU|nr:hypothetical protein KY289_033078 [Solanum tuberosum]KAH0647720.1 hypothetical protein KY285_032968 [Solanum tuberosum]KAH0740662.1 hypothetical protein KY290_033705 [Solanum tuberosum]